MDDAHTPPTIEEIELPEPRRRIAQRRGRGRRGRVQREVETLPPATLEERQAEANLLLTERRAGLFHATASLLWSLTILLAILVCYIAVPLVFIGLALLFSSSPA